MAFGDGLTSFISYKFNYQIGHTHKTYSGSLGVFVIAIIISILFNKYYFLDFNFLKYVLIGIVAFFLEFIGSNGYDNLTLPIGLAIFSYFL